MMALGRRQTGKAPALGAKRRAEPLSRALRLNLKNPNRHGLEIAESERPTALLLSIGALRWLETRHKLITDRVR